MGSILISLANPGVPRWRDGETRSKLRGMRSHAGSSIGEISSSSAQVNTNAQELKKLSDLLDDW